MFYFNVAIFLSYKAIKNHNKYLQTSELEKNNIKFITK